MQTTTLQTNHYIALLEGRDPGDVMAETLGRLAVLLDGVTAEEAERSPAPGKWSLREVMAHLADCEIVWSWRMRQILGEDNPRLQPFDQDKWAKAYSAYSFAQAFSTWKALRAWNLDFLRGLTEVDKERPAIHATHGDVTLWTVVSFAAGHDLHHLNALKTSGTFWR